MIVQRDYTRNPLGELENPTDMIIGVIHADHWVNLKTQCFRDVRLVCHERVNFFWKILPHVPPSAGNNIPSDPTID